MAVPALVPATAALVRTSTAATALLVVAVVVAAAVAVATQVQVQYFNRHFLYLTGDSISPAR